MMNHTNIIKFYGCRADAGIQYLFLEYAEGGELYDRIGRFIISVISITMSP